MVEIRSKKYTWQLPHAALWKERSATLRITGPLRIGRHT